MDEIKSNERIDYVLQTKNPRVIKSVFSTMEEALEAQKEYNSNGVETYISPVLIVPL